MASELHIIARHADRAPVDLQAIFDDFGIDYSERSIRTGESGWIERNGDNYSVVVDALDSEQRRRFTAAHELAHYILHRDLMDHGSRMMRHTDRLYDDDNRNENSPFKPFHEVQANKMAAQILMPAKLIRDRHETGLTTDQLAHEFRVSRRAMEIRLSSLGLI